MRLRRLISLIVTSIAVLWIAVLSAQQPQPLDRLVDRFVLDTATVAVGDVSADGKWIVATTGSLRGRIGIDNSRFGDPTYTAPSLVDVSVIDTTAGAAQKLFADKRQVRGFKWSPDGSRLAFFALEKNGAFAPMVWERSTGSARAIALPAGKEAADNADLEWSTDGAEVLFAVRPASWRADTKKKFAYSHRKQTGKTRIQVGLRQRPLELPEESIWTQAAQTQAKNPDARELPKKNVRGRFASHAPLP
jgi:hypothetical protein